ncbi:MAG: sigma 54-interacting transcriptional regulator [Pirellulales bacterium]|nr:sigma 54-interacting transcriptional regulator [Pirellulales bacterium]
MRFRRRHVLYFATAFAVLYSLGVLYRVQTSYDVGVQCLIANDSELGPKVRRVELSGADYVGEQPRADDLLVGLADQPVPTFLHFRRMLSGLRRTLGDEWEVGGLPSLAALESAAASAVEPVVEIDGSPWVRAEFERPGSDTTSPSSRFTTWLRLVPVPGHTLGLSLAWFLLQMMLFGLGGLVFWRRPGDASATIFFALCVVSVVAFMGGLHWTSLIGARWLLYPFAGSALLLAPLTLHFYLLFPRPARALRLHPRWTLAAVYTVPSLVAGVLLGSLIYTGVGYDVGLPVADVQAALYWLSVAIYFSVVLSIGIFLLGHAVLVRSYLRCRTTAERRQVQWILSAAAIAVLPLGVLLYMLLVDRAQFAYGQTSRTLIYLTSLLFAAAYAVSVTRHKLLYAGRLLNRGLLYVTISLAATALFCLMVGIATALVGKYYFRWENALAVGLTAMLVAVVLGLIRDRFQRALDRRFLRDKYQLDGAMRRMSRAVDRLVEPHQLAAQMLQSALEAVGCERGAVYLRGSGGKSFALAAQIGASHSAEELPADSPLATELRYRGMLSSRLGLAVLPSPGQQQLRDLDGELAFVLEQDGTVIGVTILGTKEDGGPYTPEDRTFLTALARTTTLALRSAEGHRTIEALRERMQAKLTQIAEQQQRISFLQGELLSRARHSGRPASLDDTTGGAAQEDHGIRGTSPVVRDMLAQVAKIAQSPASVLIRGESGTGKELLARAIHQGSPRAAGPFVAVHCAALSSSLLESELFGHEKGAFTGADRQRRGRFEMAHRGTLFLDEIGDVNLDTQTRLLRVLQERSFERVGGMETITTDVRLIAATHQDLEQLIARGRFREDLYYRLNVISLRSPPLRERREDIFELSLHFLRIYAERAGKHLVRFDEDALALLADFPWPGNIRQLENAIERAVVLAEGESITRDDLPPELLHPVEVREGRRPTRRQPQYAAPRPLRSERLIDEVFELERARILEALNACDGNKARAAERLGIPRSTLFSKLRKYGLT